MDRLHDMFDRILAAEPAVVIGAVSAALALAINFGLPLTGVQVDSILQFVGNALLFLAAVAGVRQSVYAPDTVQDILTGPGGVPAGPLMNIDESEKM